MRLKCLYIPALSIILQIFHLPINLSMMPAMYPVITSASVVSIAKKATVRNNHSQMDHIIATLCSPALTKGGHLYYNFIEHIFNESLFNKELNVLSTRTEQKQQRRQQILMKALELFVQKGYRETKISDIADAAGMSTGLLFHYFESKEQLYEELVRIGLEGTKAPAKLEPAAPLQYFTDFLDQLLKYAAEQPWVFLMFVLMAQAQRGNGVPEAIRALAQEVDQIEQSAQKIAQGQREGCFRDGDPYALSCTFWSSVQGVMEQLAVAPDMPTPQTKWLTDILTGGSK